MSYLNRGVPDSARQPATVRCRARRRPKWHDAQQIEYLSNSMGAHTHTHTHIVFTVRVRTCKLYLLKSRIRRRRAGVDILYACVRCVLLLLMGCRVVPASDGQVGGRLRADGFHRCVYLELGGSFVVQTAERPERWIL